VKERRERVHKIDVNKYYLLDCPNHLLNIKERRWWEGEINGRRMEIRAQASLKLEGTGGWTWWWWWSDDDWVYVTKNDGYVTEALHEMTCCECSLHDEWERNSNHKSKNHPFLTLTPHTYYVFFNSNFNFQYTLLLYTSNNQINHFHILLFINY